MSALKKALLILTIIAVFIGGGIYFLVRGALSAQAEIEAVARRPSP